MYLPENDKFTDTLTCTVICKSSVRDISLMTWCKVIISIESYDSNNVRQLFLRILSAWRTILLALTGWQSSAFWNIRERFRRWDQWHVCGESRGKNSEIGRTDGERGVECEGRSRRGGSFEEIAVCFHGSIISCIYCHCIGVFFS